MTTKFVTFELVTQDDHILQLCAELVELTANYIMVIRDERYFCYPWHQIKRLECDRDPRHIAVPPPYVQPWDFRQPPMGTMGI